MPKRRRELRLKVTGVRRKQPDARRMARAIVRLAVEMDTEQAQVLADQLALEDATRRTAIRRGRSQLREQSDDTEAPKQGDKGAA